MPRQRTSALLVRLIAAALLVGAAVGLALLAWRHPDDLGFIPPCPWYTLTSLRCPGCGITRAVHFLLQGDLAAALHLNPAGVILAPLMGGGALAYMSYALIRGRWMRLPSPPVWVGWGLFWAVIAYWLGRTVIDLWARFGA